MVRPKKHLGQHFLNNQQVAAKIAAALSGKGYGQVVEIGPGMGVLTQYLHTRSEELYLVEIDRESVDYLHRHFDLPYDHILEADFLRLPIEQLFDAPIAVIGNFPYNISTQIIFKILAHKEQVPEVVGMFQKEVAERIVAGPGSKTYGVISVLTAAFYDREYLFTVPATDFKPPPKVQSGVIRLQRKKQVELGADEHLFRLVVKTAFNQRRKTLKNALKALNLPAAMAQDPLLAKRAEQLTLEDFVYITNSLQN